MEVTKRGPKPGSARKRLAVPQSTSSTQPSAEHPEQSKTLGFSWLLSPAQPPPAPKQGVDLNPSHFKSVPGWTNVFPQQREPLANLSTERPAAFEKHNLKFFLLSQIRACGKTTGSSPLLMSKKGHAAAPPFAARAMQNTATFFLSHPPNSHTVQAQRRTFHISQNKNWRSMQIPSLNGLVLWTRNSISKTERAAKHYTNYLSSSGDKVIGVWKRSLRKIYTWHFFG